MIQIGIRITPEKRQALKIMAVNRQSTMQSEITQALDLYLDLIEVGQLEELQRQIKVLKNDPPDK